MPQRSSFLFIITFFTALLITVAICGFTVFILLQLEYGFFQKLFSFTGLMTLLIYITLFLLAFFSIKNLSALWQMKESAAKYYLFVMVLTDVAAFIWYFGYMIQEDRILLPVLLIKLCILTGILYRFYNRLPDEHTDINDSYVPFAPIEQDPANENS